MPRGYPYKHIHIYIYIGVYLQICIYKVITKIFCQKYIALHTHAHTHTRTCARTHTHTLTHTHIYFEKENIAFLSLPALWLRRVPVFDWVPLAWRHQDNVFRRITVPIRSVVPAWNWCDFASVSVLAGRRRQYPICCLLCILNMRGEKSKRLSTFFIGMKNLR